MWRDDQGGGRRELCQSAKFVGGGEIENSPKKIKIRMHLTSLNKGRMLAICSKAIS